MTQFDDVLPEIGDCGRYQIAHLILMSVVKFFAAFQTVAVVFTAGRMDFWCADGNSTTTTTNNCSAECSSWQFGSDGVFASTWRSEFNLVCSREKLVNICSTVYMVGLLLGSTAYGMVSDRWGRVVASCAAVANTWVAGVALAFSPSVEFYAALRFLSGLGASGILSVCNTFVAESVTAKYRLVWVLAGTNGWNAALCLLSAAAYFVRTHWKLELTLASPAILVVPLIVLFGESPRWLLAKNRPEAAFKRCERIASFNGRRPPARFADDMRAVSETLLRQQGSHPQATLLDLLRSSSMRRPSLLVWNNFFSASLLYYGLVLSTGKLGGSIFLNFLLGSAVAIPASIFAMIAAHLVGRPLLFAFEYISASVCMLIIAFVWHVEGYETLVVVLAITGRFFASAALDTSWAYSSEIFPTLVRNTGMGSSSTAARVGGILAPMVNLLGDFWQPLPFCIFAVINFIAGCLALLLPETRGVKLPETLQDADHEYTKPKIQQLMLACRS